MPPQSEISLANTCRPSATSAVTALLQSFDMLEFIERWNSGGGSLIGNVDHLYLAAPLNNSLGSALDKARCGFDRDDLGAAFDRALASALKVGVRGSFTRGLRGQLTSWAAAVVAVPPRLVRSGAPFQSVDEWLDWAIVFFRTPPFADPQGGDLFPEDREHRLLRAALRRHRRTAERNGWVWRITSRVLH